MKVGTRKREIYNIKMYTCIHIIVTSQEDRRNDNN